MAASSTGNQLPDYLEAGRFEALQSKARFEVKRSQWENRWEANEMSVLKALSSLSFSDPKFRHIIECEIGIAKVRAVADKLMQAAPVGGNVAAKAEAPKAAVSAAGEQWGPEGVLRDSRQFAEIAALARQALREERPLSAVEAIVAGQIRACQVLIDQPAPFVNAVDSCLGSLALEKAISASDFDPYKKIHPGATRQTALLDTISKLRQLNAPLPARPGPAPARRASQG